MDRTQAEHLIGEVDKQRSRARKALGVYWFPLAVFGAIALFGALVTASAAPRALFVLWILAWPLGLVSTAVYYGLRAHRIGLSAPPVPFIVTGVCLGIGAGLTGWLGREAALGYAGPLFLIGAGYLVFAWLQRSLLEATLAVALVVAAIVFYVVQPPHSVSLSLAFLGLASVLVAAWNYRQTATA